MADRDALIVICWLIILILVFFECFHRKLKARFGGDIRPPSNTRQSLTSFPSDAVAVGGSSSITESHFGGSFRPGRLLPLSLGNTMSFTRGIRFTGPVAMTTTSITVPTTNPCSSKEACRIPMMSDDILDEEPPPTYEEAISYAKLMSKFQSMPYADNSMILQCDDESGDAGTSRCSSADSRTNGGISSTTNSNARVVDIIPVITTTTPRTTTTAIFVNEEGSDHEEDDDDDGSSSNESGNDFDEDEKSSNQVDSNNNKGTLPLARDDSESGNSNLISKTNNIINTHEQRSGEVQCSVNVILTSSASTSKNLDRFETVYNEKTKFTGSSKREKKKFPFAAPSPPSKPVPCHPQEM